MYLCHIGDLIRFVELCRHGTDEELMLWFEARNADYANKVDEVFSGGFRSGEVCERLRQLSDPVEEDDLR